MAEQLHWYRVADVDELPEGRVKTVTAGHRSFALTHFEGKYNALDNRCPHQGGPLGEGSIENGWLRCPWHGWDFHPLHRQTPRRGYRRRGRRAHRTRWKSARMASTSGLEEEEEHTHVRTVTDVMARDPHQLGSAPRSSAWWVTPTSGWRTPCAGKSRSRRQAHLLSAFATRGPPPSPASAYGKLTGRPAACLSIAGPGATNLLTGLWDANVDRSPVLALTGQVDTQVLGPGAFQEVDLAAAFGKVSAVEPAGAAQQRSTPSW